MTKLSKEKRDRLILTCVGILGVLGALYTFVLGAQKDNLFTLNSQIASTKDKLSKAERLVRSSALIEANLSQSKNSLEARQRDMAPQGQYYYWFLQLMDQFRKKEQLETNFILDLTQPEFTDVGLLPKFPYKAATFGMRLSGRFQDIGRFVADLENAFPYFRVQNIRMAPNSVGLPGLSASQNPNALSAENEEKLIVELRVVTLIKPGTT